MEQPLKTLHGTPLCLFCKWQFNLSLALLKTVYAVLVAALQIGQELVKLDRFQNRPLCGHGRSIPS
eukprot:3992336-Amphidinium_carterae.2